jgi:hypothetical protein
MDKFNNNITNNINDINNININNININNYIDDNNINDNNYIITTNMNNKLLEILQLNNNDLKLNKEFYWTPPKEHGLLNSDYIIKPYYQLHKNPHKILDINYYNIIKDDIRNFRTLNKYQLEYIKNLSD